MFLRAVCFCFLVAMLMKGSVSCITQPAGKPDATVCNQHYADCLEERALPPTLVQRVEFHETHAGRHQFAFDDAGVIAG